MIKLKKPIVALLILTLLCSVCACSLPAEKANSSETIANTNTPINNGPIITTPEPVNATPGEMVPGHTLAEIPYPKELDGVISYQMKWDTCGDTIWIAGGKGNGEVAIAGYDTINDQWNAFLAETGNARCPNVATLSATDGALWALLAEGPTEEQIKRRTVPGDLGYYAYYLDLSNGTSQCTRISLKGEATSESSTASLSSLIGLDQQRAILSTFTATYLTDPTASSFKKIDAVVGGNEFFHVNDQLYLGTGGGYAPFDKQTLTFGQVLPDIIYCTYSSNNGHFLTQKNERLCLFDANTGGLTELFKWMDVALSYDTMGSFEGLENSKGDFFYPIDGELIQVSPGMVPMKKTLTLACFGDTRTTDPARYQVSEYSYSPDLMDAIIRFNNTDPEYRIEIKPMIYSSDGERDRLLIELATSNEIDVLDTSLLPDNALDAKLLVDLLPYVDADPDLDRSDFIPTLLSAMMKNGGLYEYTNKFTLLTLCARKDSFPGKENWTAASIERLMASNPQMQQNDGWDQDHLLTIFAWAATAEFIDWNTMSCSFDSQAYQNWLQLLKTLPATGRYAMEPKQLFFAINYADDAGFWIRNELKDDYVVAGFPEATETGSYFMKLGADFGDGNTYRGNNTRLGMMASGQNQNGAWRFLKTLMLNGEASTLDSGIPVFRAQFEQAVENSINNTVDAAQGYTFFSNQDAQNMRDLVYGTTRLVHTDDALLSVIRSEANAFLSGQKSAQDAASQTQSRMKLYLAENG